MSEAPTKTKGWAERQSEMEGWYRGFLRGPDDAGRLLADEYRIYSPVLATFHGDVLDVGGGIGLARDYLAADVRYVVLDPSSYWLDENWARINRAFPATVRPPAFVMGVGETMPFADQSFDGALAFWSLNHARDPLACIGEIARVLRPGGRALLVLEDMEPRWGDVLHRLWQDVRRRAGFPAAAPLDWHQAEIATGRGTLRHKLARRPWPLQPDHVRIDEARLRRAFRGRLRIRQRNWDGGYLCFVLERTGA